MAEGNSGESGDMRPEQKPELIYRCKKCRRIVAAQENIVSHNQGRGEASFGWRKRSVKSYESIPECTVIFVEPLKWMQPDHFFFNFRQLISVPLIHFSSRRIC